jgi:Cu+-exporting ATPase
MAEHHDSHVHTGPKRLQLAEQPLLKDPVCGMMVRADAPLRATFAGETYVFCSAHCLERFQKEPQRFAAPSATPPPSAGARPSATTDGHPTYVCPMHPEIRQPKAGACPKCGMALEPETPTAPATRTEWTCPMHPQIIRDRPGSCPICGMALEPRTITPEEPESAELTDMRRRFWVSVAISVPLVLLAMAHLLPGQGIQALVMSPVRPWIELALASPVVLWGGWPFFVRAINRCGTEA